MSSNFRRYGYVEDFSGLVAAALDMDFSKRSLRESVPNQVHTRNIIGLYNILDGVDGFGDLNVFNTFYPKVENAIDKIRIGYGYTHVELRSLMLVTLLAGEDIAEHIDEAGIYKYAHRVHIPIVTNSECVFTLDGEEGRMSAGEIVEINNTVPHFVVNGDEDRVHLIMDIVGIRSGFDTKALLNEVPKQYYIKE